VQQCNNSNQVILFNRLCFFRAILGLNMKNLQMDHTLTDFFGTNDCCFWREKHSRSKFQWEINYQIAIREIIIGKRRYCEKKALETFGAFIFALFLTI